MKESSADSERIAPPKIPVLLGATASGKTALSLSLATALNAEIISADSRQVYRDLTIGSAKPTDEQLALVPHHFINELDLLDPFDSGAFAAQAAERIADILNRGKRVLVVGGSTLYLRGLTGGFSDLPKGDAAIRARLLDELHQLGAATLYDRLKQLDPEHAATLDDTKTQRLIRSLEVIELSGKKLSDLHSTVKPPQFEFILFGLDVPREALYNRINRRVDEMMQNGFLEEAAQLYEQYGERHRAQKINALETVGYKELFEYLDKKITLADAVLLTKQHTRNYAKRQLTYFRNQFDVQWIPAPASEYDVPAAVERILTHLRPS